jgi:hypothetical protein
MFGLPSSTALRQSLLALPVSSLYNLGQQE